MIFYIESEFAGENAQILQPGVKIEEKQNRKKRRNKKKKNKYSLFLKLARETQVISKIRAKLVLQRVLWIRSHVAVLRIGT